MANAIPGQNFDQEIVDHTRNLDAPFVKWIYKKIEAEEKLKELYVELDRCQNLIIKAIDELECDDYKSVLMMKYISFKSWSQIADELYCSIATVRRWHDKAVSLINLKDEQG